jgi:hypothetical protein
MSAFITRVELLHATEEDYQKLHTVMEALHFFSTIQDLTTGIHYRLPANTYYSKSEEETSFVLRLAQTAAKKTKRNYSALTVKSDGINFSGLEIATGIE